ncbi:Dyp-type peroxidase [Streptomyces sp. NPDC002073]
MTIGGGAFVPPTPTPRPEPLPASVPAPTPGSASAPAPESAPGPVPEPAPTRRAAARALAGTAVGAAAGVALTVGGCGRPAPEPSPARPSPPPAPTADGRRQRGVADPQPRHVLLLAYDLDPRPPGAAARDRLAAVLRQWRTLLAGSGVNTGPHLTATIAFGTSLPGRLGAARPDLLREPPAFPGDRLRPEAGGGDLLVQICGPGTGACTRVAALLDRAAGPVLRARWRQAGFLPATPAGETPRNLLGFKDGTANPGPAGAARWVWIGSGPHTGGTYLVVRRVRLRTAAFGDLPYGRQERIIGRRRADGAPLHGGPEHTDVDLFAKTPEGRYVLPADAHARLAHSRFDGGARMLRRGYSYDNGGADRGLLFVAFMNDPGLFTRVQRRLAAADALNPFVEHVGSGVYLVPPAPEAGGTGEGPLPRDAEGGLLG